MNKLFGIAKTIVARASGIHLAQNHLNAHGQGTLQSLIEGYALRALAAVAGVGYAKSPKIKAAIDAIIQAVS